MKLRSKLLIPVILIVIIGIASLALNSYSQVKNNLVLDLVKDQLNSQLDTTINTIHSREEIMEVTKNAMNEKTIALTKSVAEIINGNPAVLSTENMIKLANKIGVDEIHVTDENGVIVNGTVSDFYGFDFHSSDQTKPFLEIINKNDFTLAQKPSVRGTDGNLFQYIGVTRLDQPGIVQIGLQPKHIQDLMAIMNTKDLIKEIEIGENGYAFLVSLEGKTIAHPDESKIGEDLKSFEWSKPIFEEEEGDFPYEVDGITKYCTFKNIGNYIVAIVYPETEFLSELNDFRTNILITLLIIIAILSLIVPFLINKLVAKPLENTVEVMEKVGEGDLNAKINTSSKDEIGILGNNFNKMVDNIRNMTVKVKDTIIKLEESSEIIASSTEEVTVASEEVSKTVQEIASGATNQAQESSKGYETTSGLAEKIEEMTEKVKMTVENTNNMKKKNQQGVESITVLGDRFNENTKITETVAQSVKDLAEKSKTIGVIVETINSISAQTNLLALNAAIEAARAGEHGQGFAVVADEVRKLAEQSSIATMEIQEIINEIRQVIDFANSNMDNASQLGENVNKSLNDTNDVFNEMKQSVDVVIEQIEGLSLDINQVDVAKDDVLNSIENISAVAEQSAAATQQISASTEEQTASMEEIAASVQELNDIVRSLAESIEMFNV